MVETDDERGGTSQSIQPGRCLQRELFGGFEPGGAEERPYCVEVGEHAVGTGYVLFGGTCLK